MFDKNTLPEKHISPREQKQNGRFAQIIANILKRLIKDEIISTTNVIEASFDVMWEFLVRYQLEIYTHHRETENKKIDIDPFSTKEVQEKIRKIFTVMKNLEGEKEQFLKRREEAILYLRDILQRLNNEIKTDKVLAILAFGSMMDPDKLNPKDLDVIFLIDDQPLSDKEWKAMKNLKSTKDSVFLVNQWQKKEHFKTKYELHIVQKYYFEEFIEIIKCRRNLSDKFLYWTTKPSAVVVVGGTEKCPENKVNNLVKTYLNSETISRKKMQVIEAIKEIILQPVKNA